MICEFVVVLNPGKTADGIEDTLLSSLSEAVENDLDELDGFYLASLIEIKFVKQINADFAAFAGYHKAFCSFDLELSREIANPDRVLENFISNVQDAVGVEHLIKFHDDLLLENNSKFVPMLFKLEMKLRKAISLIYLLSYREGYYDLLREEVVEIAKKDGQKPTQESMKKFCENEFFHLLFSQYVNLNNRKSIARVEGLIDLICQRNAFEEVRQEISRKIVSNEVHQDFLASLKQIMDPIEKLRNCIAHNRTPSPRMITDFERSYEEANAAIDAFLKTFGETEEVEAEEASNIRV